MPCHPAGRAGHTVDHHRLAANYADPADLGTLDEAAEDRGLYRDAARLYKQASAHGSAGAGPTSFSCTDCTPVTSIQLIGPPPTQASATHSTWAAADRQSTRLNSSHRTISYAVFWLKKKK